MTKAQFDALPDEEKWAIVYNLTPKPEPKPIVEPKPPIVAPGGTNG
jgi:hypothetical protein